jgi:hypothetical protein
MRINIVSCKTVIPIIAMQVQTLLKEVNTQLQLVITSENNGRFSVQNNIIVDYDKLTPEALQSMNEKLLGIYKELLDCVRVETMQPFPGANLASPSLIPDNPVLSPLWETLKNSPYETFGRPDFSTFCNTNNPTTKPSTLSEEDQQQFQLANEFENKFPPGKCDYTVFYSTYFNFIENKDGAVYQLLLKPSFSETKFYTPIAETKNIATDKNFFNFFKFYTVSQLMIVEKV